MKAPHVFPPFTGNGSTSAAMPGSALIQPSAIGEPHRNEMPWASNIPFPDWELSCPTFPDWGFSFPTLDFSDASWFLAENESEFAAGMGGNANAGTSTSSARHNLPITNDDQVYGPSLLGQPTSLPIQDSAVNEILCSSLSEDGEAEMLNAFKGEVFPPLALFELDPSGWSHIKQYLLRSAANGKTTVRKSLISLTTALRPKSPVSSGTSSCARAQHGNIALRFHRAAQAAIESELQLEGWEDGQSNTLLAAVFILAWFEVRDS